MGFDCPVYVLDLLDVHADLAGYGFFDQLDALLSTRKIVPTVHEITGKDGIVRIQNAPIQPSRSRTLLNQRATGQVFDPVVARQCQEICHFPLSLVDLCQSPTVIIAQKGWKKVRLGYRIVRVSCEIKGRP